MISSGRLESGGSEGESFWTPRLCIAALVGLAVMVVIILSMLLVPPAKVEAEPVRIASFGGAFMRDKINFNFVLRDAKQREVCSSGQVSLKIRDKQYKLVYEDSFRVSCDDFGYHPISLGYSWDVPVAKMSEPSTTMGWASLDFIAPGGRRLNATQYMRIR